ncbi:FG-GAP repeat domain-containing protein [Streptomyces xanthophaeus]|uniref:FG-GAP repeat domain-containing protein n=1 Tax=Streptomyces xanthophaeus TaxID=67385 RepID=UPI0026473990|nr:VCBS repeat-containing protein [Streptomyces xanthophaeus]WKD34916.1 VCBS repeat-containing protein [Streptomyces xanthophaeus]
MTLRTPLRALPAAALSLALGLAAAAPASAAADPAAPKVTAPRTGPAPGFAGEGRSSDCYTDPYAGSGAGWIGLNDVTTKVTATSASHAQLQTTFQLWDTSYGGARTDFPTVWSTYPEAATNLSRDLLKDGGQYAWRARATDGKLTSPYTAWCYFRVDHTRPTAEVTTDETPKKVGEEATFTLKGTDDGSGIACARWQTSPVFGVGWSCADEATDSRVVRLTDGSADIKVKPATWGSQAVYLQTMDNAGNLGEAQAYYYAQASTKPAAFGDIDADGKPDVLVPDAAGNLRKPGANPLDPANARRLAAPGGGESWAGVQYTHRGSFGEQAVDDLMAHAPGGTYVYRFTNDGAGQFTDQSPTLVNKPTQCLDAAGSVIDCAQHGFGPDWSKVTQIAAYGSPTGDSTVDGLLPRTSLLFVENGRLWLAQRGGIRLRTATLLSGDDTRWAGYDLLTPGRAQGTDFPTLWARSRADGAIRAFSVRGSADAPDFSAFTDPAAGPVLSTLTPATHPRVGSDGDLTGDGLPDLWSADATGHVTVFPGTGTTAPHPTVTGFGPAV